MSPPESDFSGVPILMFGSICIKTKIATRNRSSEKIKIQASRPDHDHSRRSSLGINLYLKYARQYLCRVQVLQHQKKRRKCTASLRVPKFRIMGFVSYRTLDRSRLVTTKTRFDPRKRIFSDVLKVHVFRALVFKATALPGNQSVTPRLKEKF